MWTVIGVVLIVVGGLFAIAPATIPSTRLDRRTAAIVGAVLVVAGLAVIVWLR